MVSDSKKELFIEYFKSTICLLRSFKIIVSDFIASNGGGNIFSTPSFTDNPNEKSTFLIKKFPKRKQKNYIGIHRNGNLWRHAKFIWNWENINLLKNIEILNYDGKSFLLCFLYFFNFPFRRESLGDVEFFNQNLYQILDMRFSQRLKFPRVIPTSSWFSTNFFH